MKTHRLLLLPFLLSPVLAQAQTTNGRVTSAAPSYTNATTSPFSLTTGGGLRIDLRSIAGTSTQTGNGTATSSLRVTLASDSTGQVALAAGSAVIGHVITDSGSTTAVTGNVATTVADGSNVTLGAIADAASATGSISAKLRFIAATGIPITGTVTVASHAVTNAGTFATQSAITAASGALASGSIASGAVASGAVASGAYASGSISAGAIAAGASSLVKLEDVASADADAGVPSMCTRKATAANTSGTDGDYEFLECSAGRLWVSATVDAALPAGTNTIGNVVTVPSATAGGTTLFTLTLAASTNATNVKASAGQLYSISGFNMSSATPVWISLYNTAGTPTCGTSIIQQFLIPGNTTGAGFVYDFSSPKAFATGIGFCATTGIAGTGNPAATTYVLNIDYK